MKTLHDDPAFPENEVFDVIFTHEKGQTQMTIPLKLLPPTFFDSKSSMEENLLFAFEAATSFRIVGSVAHKMEGKSPKLFKISTCIYSESYIPEWYGSWDGKFYYS